MKDNNANPQYLYLKYFGENGKERNRVIWMFSSSDHGALGICVPGKCFLQLSFSKTHNYSLCKRDKSTGTYSSRGCHLSQQLRQHLSGLLGWKNSIKGFLVEKCLEVSLAPHVPSTLLLFIKPLPPPSAEPSMGCFLASAPSLMELK